MRILNRLKTALEYVTGEQNAPALSNLSKEAVVKQSGSGKVGDVNDAQASIDLKNKISGIIQKCKENGIGKEEAIETFIKPLGLTKEQMDKLPLADKMLIVSCIEVAVNHYIKVKNKYGTHKNADAAKVIATDTKNSYEAVKNTNINSAEELKTQSGDINKELGNNFRKKTQKEKKQQVIAHIKKWRAKREAYVQAELLKYPEEMRAQKRKEFDEETRYIEREQFIQFAQTHSSEETASLGMLLMQADEMAYATRATLETRSSDEERQRVADDIMTVENQIEVLEGYSQLNQTVSSSVVQEATEVKMAAKSTEAAFKFEQDWNGFRAEVESQRKAGKEKAPYITEEVMKATSVGIASGAVANEKMTTEEKAKFLNQWESHIKNFGDYNEVKAGFEKAVQKFAAEHPDKKQVVENLRKILKEKYNKEFSLEKKEVSVASVKKQPVKTQAGKNNETPVVTTPFVVHSTKQNTIKASQQLEVNEQKTEKTFRPKLSETGLQEALGKLSVDKVLDNYSNSIKEIMEVVFADPAAYRDRFSEIIRMSKGLSGKDIGQALIGCDTSVISEVMLANPSQKRDEIWKEVEPYMCYAGRKITENIVENDKDETDKKDAV